MILVKFIVIIIFSNNKFCYSILPYTFFRGKLTKIIKSFNDKVSVGMDTRTNCPLTVVQVNPSAKLLYLILTSHVLGTMTLLS